jgi:hypothetical protein
MAVPRLRRGFAAKARAAQVFETTAEPAPWLRAVTALILAREMSVV